MTLVRVLFVVLLFSVTSQARICESDDPSATNIFYFASENLKSFGYLNHALQQLKAAHPESKTCFSATVIGKNTLGYNYYWFQIYLSGPQSFSETSQPRLHLLFQDGPIQAYHNGIGLPWIGLNPTAVSDQMESVINNNEATLYDLDDASAENPLDWIQQTGLFQAGHQRIDLSSLSFVEIKTPHKAGKYYLVTWLQELGKEGTDSLVQPQGALLTRNGPQLVAYENISLFSEILVPFQNNETATRPATKSFEDWVQALLNLFQ